MIDSELGSNVFLYLIRFSGICNEAKRRGRMKIVLIGLLLLTQEKGGGLHAQEHSDGTKSDASDHKEGNETFPEPVGEVSTPGHVSISVRHVSEVYRVLLSLLSILDGANGRGLNVLSRFREDSGDSGREDVLGGEEGNKVSVRCGLHDSLYLLDDRIILRQLGAQVQLNASQLHNEHIKDSIGENRVRLVNVLKGDGLHHREGALHVGVEGGAGISGVQDAAASGQGRSQSGNGLGNCRLAAGVVQEGHRDGRLCSKHLATQSSHHLAVVGELIRADLRQKKRKKRRAFVSPSLVAFTRIPGPLFGKIR